MTNLVAASWQSASIDSNALPGHDDGILLPFRRKSPPT